MPRRGSAWRTPLPAPGADLQERAPHGDEAVDGGEEGEHERLEGQQHPHAEPPLHHPEPPDPQQQRGAGGQQEGRERPQVLRLEPTDLKIAQALADVGSVAILHRQTVTRSEQVTAQLQHALNSRVIIEQAKGKLSEQGNIDTGEAFGALRRHARSHRQQLSATARAVVAGHLTLEDLNPGAPNG